MIAPWRGMDMLHDAPLGGTMFSRLPQRVFNQAFVGVAGLLHVAGGRVAASSSSMISYVNRGAAPPRSDSGGAQKSFMEIKVDGCEESTVTVLQTVSSSNPLNPNWSKNGANILKTHIGELNKARGESIHCPMKGLIDRVDAMVSATFSSQKMVRAIVVYLRKYNNISQVYEDSRGFMEWQRSAGALAMDPDLMAILIKAEVHYASQHAPKQLEEVVFDPIFAIQSSAQKKAQTDAVPAFQSLAAWTEDWLFCGLLAVMETFGDTVLDECREPMRLLIDSSISLLNRLCFFRASPKHPQARNG